MKICRCPVMSMYDEDWPVDRLCESLNWHVVRLYAAHGILLMLPFVLAFYAIKSRVFGEQKEEKI